MKKILAIDGGGIKGVFPAAFLASLESTMKISVADYFDLIVGSSTGGLIALGLGKGLTANEILTFYVDHGPSIFGGNRVLRWVRRIGRAKYDSEPLRDALRKTFGTATLGESRKRLVIPSANLETGQVHIFKTQHHPRLQTDHVERMIDVALATAAAPTYFPTQTLGSGVPLIDGGVWANNPTAVAVVEAITMLGWKKNDFRVLSLGCTTQPFNARSLRGGRGLWSWSQKMVDVFMATQSSASHGMALHLAGHENVYRVSPVVASNRFALDDAGDIEALRGLGASTAREWLPKLAVFFEQPAEVFQPIASR